jgi:hypothetical protein
MGQFLCKNRYLLSQGPRLTGSARAVKVGPGSAYLKGSGGGRQSQAQRGTILGTGW